MGSANRHNISVRRDDQPIWDAAVEAARARRMPVSGLVLSALAAYLTAEYGYDFTSAM